MALTDIDNRKSLCEISVVDDTKQVAWNLHKYQQRMMDSQKRFILVLAGTQGGKTSVVPLWLYREISRCGAGDYLFVTPTYKLLQLKALPEFLKLFERILGLGTLNKSEKVFEFSEQGEKLLFGAAQLVPTKIFFGHAQDPDSLESATAKAAVLDECGQKKFKLSSFEAIMRRLSIYRGRILMTTTPYYLGWLKDNFWNPWIESGRDHPDIDVIRFPSTANPWFSQEEFESARAILPKWKFDMFYRAVFTRPAGMIFDCFDESIHKVKPFPIPETWTRRHIGFDFGGVNTAAVVIASEPEGNKHYVIDEYHAGNQSIEEHAKNVLNKVIGKRITAYGGAPSEDQWRHEFSKYGLTINRPPVADVEVGINLVYRGFKSESLLVFNSCKKLLDELMSYSREIDDLGNPTQKIEDKHAYHLCDSLRYICTHLIGTTRQSWGGIPTSSTRTKRFIESF
jgi:hypothetical protein